MFVWVMALLPIKGLTIGVVKVIGSEAPHHGSNPGGGTRACPPNLSRWEIIFSPPNYLKKGQAHGPRLIQ
jgi:hypothetical protein